MPVIRVHGRWRQEELEFTIICSHIASLETAWASRSPIFQINFKNFTFSPSPSLSLIIFPSLKKFYKMKQKYSNEQEIRKFTCPEDLNDNQSETDEVTILKQKVCFNWFQSEKLVTIILSIILSM